MIGNIYKITDIINNKVYIGQTKRDIMRRYSDHISHAFTSKRPNDLSCSLYIAMRKYGIQNFVPELIETIEGSPKEIDKRRKNGFPTMILLIQKKVIIRTREGTKYRKHVGKLPKSICLRQEIS